MSGRWLSGRRERRAGTVSAELALVVPILVLLLFAMVEFGLILRASSQIKAVAREGARAAAMGVSPTIVGTRVDAMTLGLDEDEMQVILQWRVLPIDGSPGGWAPLVGNGDENTVPQGSEIMALVLYEHPLVMPGLFGQLLGAHDGKKELQARLVMLRE